MKISIITATYNSEKTIIDTLESVNLQSYDNIEHIIVDGGSTDNTLEFLKQYGKRVSIFISEDDNGIYDALNKGINLATGDVIGFLHSDDIYYDNSVIAKIIESFRNNDIHAVYGDLNYVKRDNPSIIIRRWKSSKLNMNKFKNGWMPPHPTFFMRRCKYLSLGGFSLNYKISADYDSILRYLLHGEIEAIYMPYVITNMRLGGISNRSIMTILCKISEDIRIMKYNDINWFRGIIGKNIRKLPQFFNKF